MDSQRELRSVLYETTTMSYDDGNGYQEIPSIPFTVVTYTYSANYYLKSPMWERMPPTTAAKVENLFWIPVFAVTVVQCLGSMPSYRTGTAMISVK